MFVRLTWARMGGIKRKAGFIIGIFIWPFLLFKRASMLLLQRGTKTGEASGVSLRKQFLDMIIIGFLYGKPPHIYYMYGFFDGKRPHDVRDYLTLQEFRGLVESAGDEHTRNLVEDKLLFESTCTSLGIPSVKTLVVFDNGVTRFPYGERNTALPGQDLFVKPNDSHGGRGCVLFEWNEGKYRGSDGSVLGMEEMVDRLTKASAADTLLVQPRIRNHPSIEKLGVTALATVRVLSAINSTGAVAPLRAIFKVPRSGMIVDNLGRGGIGYPVDLKSGVVSGGGYTKASSSAVDRHPDEGFMVSGFELPHWNEVLALTTRLHQLFPGLAFAGWDIALTENGCLLIEGNDFPGIESIQQAHGPLLSDPEFLSLCMELGGGGPLPRDLKGRLDG
jgi:hypothetical protein